jgi:hypothetical protein
MQVKNRRDIQHLSDEQKKLASDVRRLQEERAPDNSPSVTNDYDSRTMSFAERESACFVAMPDKLADMPYCV